MNAQNTTAPTPTERVIVSMLTENTGRHMLDSGGAYGRNWERNQGLTVEACRARPQGTIEFYTRDREDGFIDLDMLCYLDLFHFMEQHLNYRGDLDLMVDLWVRWYDARAKERGGRECTWLGLQADLFDGGLVTEFVEWFASLPDEEIPLTDEGGTLWTPEDIREAVKWWAEEGIHANAWWGNDGPATINTYNHNSLLSQTVQYVYGEADCTEIYFWSIHGGCDVRGGYTRPRFFEGSGCSEAGATRDLDATLSPNVEEWSNDTPRWFSYDGGTFETDDRSVCEDFNDYPVSRDPELRGKGYVVVDEEAKVLYCPITGAPLELYQ